MGDSTLVVFQIHIQPTLDNYGNQIAYYRIQWVVANGNIIEYRGVISIPPYIPDYDSDEIQAEETDSERYRPDGIDSCVSDSDNSYASDSDNSYASDSAVLVLD